MKIVIEIENAAKSDASIHHSADRFPLRLGRAYDNDLILDDPHVSPHHAQIEHDGLSFTLHDLGSINGTSINGKPCGGGPESLRSGDKIKIGRTVLHLYDARHPVAETLPLHKTSSFFKLAENPLFVWPLFLITLLVMMGWTWLEVWTEETAFALAVTAGTMTAVLLVWAALWSAAGKLTRNRPGFTTHISFACLYLLGSALLWYIQSAINFLTNASNLATVTSAAFNFALVTPLLYGALGQASRLTAKRRLMASALFSLGLLSGIYALEIAGKKDFEQKPDYPATLLPYLSAIAPVQSVEKFFVENESVFKENILKPSLNE